jgi:hypothetical protein
LYRLTAAEVLPEASEEEVGVAQAVEGVLCLESFVGRVAERLRCWKRDSCIHRWDVKEELSSELYCRHTCVCVLPTSRNKNGELCSEAE